MMKIRPVILCGGSGTRLWPLSRAGFPKQFLCLTGRESLFQLAAMRLMSLARAGVTVQSPYVVTNEEHRFIALEQLREIDVPPGGALLEPVSRNTAPAMTLAAHAAKESGEDPILVVVPADQTVANLAAFVNAMQVAIQFASQGGIGILGVRADAPETGYGYIKAASVSVPPFQVERFVEKPDAAKAAQYVADGDYFWNAGMFVVKASVWLAALDRFRPDIAASSRLAWAKRAQDAEFVRPGKAEFAAIPSESIDYAVIERCPGSEFPISVVPLDAGWSDLGAWDAVWKVLDKDEMGNASQGDVLISDSRNTLVHATSRLVSVIGVENLVVVETPDAVLVTDRSRSQDVKHIVNELESSGRNEHTLHRKVQRPWGWYDSIDDGERFKVKRIMVNPKASLSLQKHFHRAEHWVVVRGTAEVTNGEKTVLLTENQSTYIPLGEVHRLANPGAIPLEIIEVQSGTYLGEDDIVRLEDTYGRG